MVLLSGRKDTPKDCMEHVHQDKKDVQKRATSSAAGLRNTHREREGHKDDRQQSCLPRMRHPPLMSSVFLWIVLEVNLEDKPGEKENIS